MEKSTLFLSLVLLYFNACFASPFILSSDQSAFTNTSRINTNLDVSIGFDSNPIANFFNLLEIAFNQFQYLLTKFTTDGTNTMTSSTNLYIKTINATFDFIRGTTIRTVDDFLQKAEELQEYLESAVSSGWDLAGDLFVNGQYLLALPVTAFTIYLKTVWGALTALRFEIDAGLSFASSNATTTTSGVNS